MNATDEKIFCVVCWYKKRREKGLEPLFALFCRPIDFKKTNFTIIIIKDPSHSLSRTCAQSLLHIEDLKIFLGQFKFTKL